MRSYRKEAVLSPLFKLFEVVFELTVPLVIAKIIDVGIAQSDKSYILHASLLLALFAVLGLFFALFAQYFAAKAAAGTAANLKERIFHKLTNLSYRGLDTLGTSKMCTLMTSDVNQVQTGVNMALRLFLRSPFVVFGAAILAFTVDKKVSIVFFAVIPILFLVIFAVMGICVPLYQRAQSKLDRVYLKTRENLSGVRVIRAFSLEEDEKADFEEAAESLLKAQKRAGRLSALTNPLTFAIINLAIVLLLFFGAVRVDGGFLEKGQVVALYAYLSQILIELLKLANLVVTEMKASASLKRIEKVFSLPEEERLLLPKEDFSSLEAVRFEDVSFSYGGESALMHANLSIRRGETLGILGGTGAGKSTLVNLIPRFLVADEGKVSVFGADVKAVEREELRKRIAFVPQKAVLFHGSLKSNLLWGNENASDEELYRALSIAQAKEFVDQKGGLEFLIEQEGRNLSGGQRQRLTIARALVKAPEILILDDSSSALDYETEKNLRAALKTLSCTVILVSQRASSLMHAERIVVLDEGKIAGIGTHESLLKDCLVYREIWASQQEGA